MGVVDGIKNTVVAAPPEKLIAKPSYDEAPPLKKPFENGLEPGVPKVSTVEVSIVEASIELLTPIIYLEPGVNEIVVITFAPFPPPKVLPTPLRLPPFPPITVKTACVIPAGTVQISGVALYVYNLVVG